MAVLKDALMSGNVSHGWIKTPYGVKLAEDPESVFKTLAEVEEFVIANDKNKSKKAEEWLKLINEQNASSPSAMDRDGLADTDYFYTRPNYTDTRVGGNDAINPYWQFCRDDDIVPELLSIKTVGQKEGPGMSEGGMGRVYSETYDNHQQILWLSMGVPEFTNLTAFYMDAGDKNAANAMNRGSFRGLVGGIIRIAFRATVWAITFPVTAPFYLNRWLSRSQTDRITKYYYFKPAMVVYYEMVNTMITYLAVSMGLYPQYIKKRKDSTKNLKEAYDLNDPKPAPEVPPATTTSGADGMPSVTAATVESNIEGAPPPTTPDMSDTFEHIGEPAVDELYHSDPSNTSIPDILRNGPDIFVIMNRRARIFDKARTEVTTRMLSERLLTDNQSVPDEKDYFMTPNKEFKRKSDTAKDSEWVEAEDPINANTEHTWVKWWSSLKANCLGAGDFVGFRIERSVSCSEGVSNQTGPTGLAQKLNAIAQENKDKFESGGNTTMGRFLTTVAMDGDVNGALQNVLKQVTANIASAVGLGDIGAIMTAGSGFLDIPDVWKDSSFQRSYSFTVQLRARYGDPVSIFQSVYIPLAMLLTASLPRSIGNNMYTSPFLVKAYCKGMFAVPCGIMDIRIQRGKDEFGWSNDMLPTAVDISVDIKDLTPTFFLSMQDIGFFDTFSRNDNMLEYLDTLSAIGITERMYYWPKVMRKLATAIATTKRTIFSSTYHSMRTGRSNLARAIASVSPFAYHEQSDMRPN